MKILVVGSGGREHAMAWRFGATRYDFAVSNPERRCRGVAEAELDGVPVEEYRLEDLRRNIAVVLQDVFLFSGSVEENIRMKADDIDPARIEAVAKEIGAYDFIGRLLGGFASNVMERGSALSVGQRQLISFIRALSTDPAVIVLDEATSSLDAESERLVQDALD
jgi:ATP-binding cassette subfamily B protein